ncbi:response regulator [Luteibacter aegosomaticola]|uniref:response regulator n=1 Tax=Luteibacter aegosomaticola TaxID=2911538 RepID=UPI001FF7EC13|nr:response regulator [Luteibacter aegosomaticola]UPG90374.1 response regulator [Luteibacter aegosomaticola]
MTDAPSQAVNSDLAWLDGGGELGALIRAFDWEATGLGALPGWPQSLRTATGMLLLSPVPIVLLWGEKGIMIYNDAYSVFAGGRHPQLLGSEVRQGWAEIADFNDNVMRVGLAGGTLAYKDQKLTLERHGKPEPVWMNLDYSPVLDESGRAGGVIAIVVETTERVRAEERLRESESRFRALVNATSDVVYQMDPSWVRMNALDGRGFIADTTEPSPDWMAGYVPADEQPRVRTAIDEAVLTQGIFEIEHRVKRIDGSIGWVQSRAVPVMNAEGAIIEWFGAAADISVRKSAEQALRENESRLRFLDTLNELTARSTDADEILRISTRLVGEHLGVAVCAYADMDADEDGMTIRGDWTLPGYASIVGRYRLRDFGRLAVARLREGKPLIIEDNVRELPADESSAFQALGISATICIPLIKGGKLTALMAIHDGTPREWHLRELALLDEVTERSWAHIARVRAEADVREGERRFREELEQQVIERSAALERSQAHIRQTQKMEALGSLTGGIAHDFNNLLMAVQGSLELLRERMPKDPLLLRLVDNARAGAERGSSLTRRMLAFARRQDLKAERVDLRTLVDGMTELMQRSLGPTVTIETRFTPGLPAVEADANQLESALLNLAVNARDAMDGVGTITISTDEAWVGNEDERLLPGHYVRLTLADTGAGMDEHTLKRATEPFFTTKGVGKGTGLGLSMAHGLAEQLGGMLVLRSVPDEGTTAEIWLPAMAAAASASAPEPTTPLLKPRCPATRRLSIMMVDDDDLVRATTVEMLEDLGYDVVAARSGAEALGLLGEQMVDLVVTDHAMPHMTGAQLAMELRERWPALPVIMATGYADLPAGVQLERPRLAKPYSQATLADAIVRALPCEN